MNETGAKDSAWALPSANRWLTTLEQTCDSPAPAPTEAALKSSSKRSVLIVEDDWAARLAISRILQKLGFAVSEASSVAEAIRAGPAARVDSPGSDAPGWLRHPSDSRGAGTGAFEQGLYRHRLRLRFALPGARRRSAAHLCQAVECGAFDESNGRVRRQTSTFDGLRH